MNGFRNYGITSGIPCANGSLLFSPDFMDNDFVSIDIIKVPACRWMDILGINNCENRAMYPLPVRKGLCVLKGIHWNM